MPGVPVPSPHEHKLLATSAYYRKGNPQHSDTTLYRAASGAWVFATGTMGWTTALHAEEFADERLQRATRNLLNKVLAAPQ